MSSNKEIVPRIANDDDLKTVFNTVSEALTDAGMEVKPDVVEKIYKDIRSQKPEPKDSITNAVIFQQVHLQLDYISKTLKPKGIDLQLDKNLNE